jgi:hypothetical protein
VLDRQHRVGGAELRAQRARQELEAFTAANARALLEEREETARGVTAELTRAVAATVRAHRAYLAERQHVDQLVSAVPEASTRYDDTGTSYPWADALRELERALSRELRSDGAPPALGWRGAATQRRRRPPPTSGAAEAAHRRCSRAVKAASGRAETGDGEHAFLIAPRAPSRSWRAWPWRRS